MTRRLAALAVAAAAVASCGDDRPVAATRAGSVDLLALLPAAQLAMPEAAPDSIARWRQTTAGETRDVLFMHPPSRAVFPPVRLTLESRLELGFGVHEQAWTQPGDGVQFVVAARTADGEERRLFAAYLDPKHVAADRRWADAVVLLGTYAGREVSLVLATEPGPSGDRTWDWAGWSRAEVRLGAD
jgi:hypothetical protein